MASLAPWNIYYPEQGTQLTPLASHFTLLAQSTSDALTDISTGVVRSVGSSTARNTLYPTPAAGQKVWRTDLGYMEVYYTLYNSSTNPAGATPAGWYPAPGSDIAYQYERPTTDTWPGTGLTSMYSTSWSSVPAGKYRLSISSFIGSTTDGPGDIGLYAKSGAAAQAEVAHGFLDLVAGQRINTRLEVFYNHAGGTLALEVKASNIGGGTKSIYVYSRLSAQYIGPVR